MKRISLLLGLCMVLGASTWAQKGTEAELIKEANQFFQKEEYLKAYPLFSQLVSLYPQHPEYNFKFGACAIYSQADKSQAIKHLTYATNKNVEDARAWYFLGKAHHLNYDFKEAMAAYRTFDEKADAKLKAEYQTAREIEMCNYGTGLLANMKDVIVLNKVESDRDNFFRYFNLEEIGGRILTLPIELQSKLDQKSTTPGVIHYPGNSTTIYFSSYGKDGSTGKDIYKAQILPAGGFSAPEKLLGDVNTGYDEDYCFMASDGKTLYFSSKGHNSMGGYDIFKSVLDPTSNTFGPAINLDFAINTPDDDIFYVSDAQNKKAYFASARSSDQGHMHVYNVMVESQPMQVIYIKGDYLSEINNEQKDIKISIKEDGTDRPIYDGTSNGTTGNYMLYVPKSGTYNFLVTTENSPLVHKASVEVPYFDHPVALRQEMRLVKENGVEKLIVNNFFETPLDEDLSELAADMLRHKAGLDVNANDDVLRQMEEEVTAEDITVEKTMTNVPLAAGFAEGISVADVMGTMQNDVNGIRQFVNDAGRKSDLSYAYAAQKQKEAEALLSKAEQIRANTNTYMNEDDVSRLRESHQLSLEAEKLKGESAAAMAAAESTSQYAKSETERADALQANLDAVRKSAEAQDFDGTLAAMKTEKERQVALRGGQAGTPVDELTAKANAAESQQKASMQNLATLREEETKLATQLKATEQSMAAAKKKSDKESLETEYANLKSALDNKRRQINTENINAEKLEDQANAQKAHADFFGKLLADKNDLGLTAEQKVKLSDTDRSTLAMKLGDMDARLEALEIHDTQMLALLGEPVDSQSATAQNAPAESKVADLRAGRDSALASLDGNDPKANENKRLINEKTLADTENRIAALESRSSQLAPEERTELDQLRSYRTELNESLAVQAPPRMLTRDEKRVLYASVSPTYEDETQRITNLSGTELDRQTEWMNLQASLLISLEAQKKANTEAAQNTTDPAQLSDLASRNEQIQSAISELKVSSTDIGQYRTAYELENKNIIENDEEFADKLGSQVVLTEDYLSILNKEETKSKADMAAATAPEDKTQIQARLDQIGREKEMASAKLAGYRSDRDLTMAASQSKSADPSTALNAAQPLTSLEDQIEAEVSADNSAVAEEVEETPVVEEDEGQIIQGLFKRPEEEESIIAYETGALEEIIAHHTSDTCMVKNREQIAQIQDQIFLVEAEMENETSIGKQKKLDRDAEKLYLKKSLLEIDNAEAIGKMTQAEFDQRLASMESKMKENKEKTDSRVMIRDELKALYNKAKDEMEDAEILRKRGGPVIDDIEKNDYYRRAFSKEVNAIRMLENMEDIYANLDMMMKYNDQELMALRYGKKLPPPASTVTDPATAVAAAVTPPVTNPALANKAATAPGTTTGQVANKTTTIPAATTGQVVNKSATAALPASGTASNTAASTTAMTPVPAMMKADAIATSHNLDQEAATLAANAGMTADEMKQTTQFVAFSEAAAKTAALDNQRMTAIEERNAAVAQVSANEKKIAELQIAKAAATTQAEKDSIQAEIDVLLKQNAASTASIAKMDSNILAMQGNVTTSQKATDAAYAAAVTAANAKSATAATNAATPMLPGSPAGSAGDAGARASAGSYSAAEAEGMFFRWPSTLEKDLFLFTDHSVYSESKPIPVDIAMPAGVYYKVQVGAFRNSIPQNLYDEFAPVGGEALANGITRYTAGFFMNYQNADAAKGQIRQIGYSDAFVVAFRNGKRIPLYEAMGVTEGADFMAHVENEYIHGDNAPKPAVAEAKSAAGFTADDLNKFYAKYPAAAKANMVEKITGLFYTVQVGVYSKPVTAADLHYINPLNTELNERKQVRYTTGIFTDLKMVVDKRAEARAMGVSDAFVTAYFNGKRISLSEADKLIREQGPSVLTTTR